ncbi:MAG: TIGR00266 family protein [Candidatus Micrarchaeia archaeon]
MKAQIKNTTVGQILVFTLSKGEYAYVEPGGIISSTGQVEIKSEIAGGLESGILRMFGGGESAFINKVTAIEDTVLEVGVLLPSEIIEVNLDGAMILGDGVYLAHTGDINISSKFGWLTSLVAGAGLMFLYAEGKGKLYLAGAESMFIKKLGAGESFYVDNACFVGTDANAKIEKFIVGKGLVSKIVSGEGIMLKITGPATVYYQTESPVSLAEYITRYLKRGKNYVRVHRIE